MGKNCPGRGKNTCKGPEAAMTEVLLRQNKELNATIA